MLFRHALIAPDPPLILADQGEFTWLWYYIEHENEEEDILLAVTKNKQRDIQ